MTASDLCGLLRSNEIELQRAAARVLGALRIDGSEVVESLASGLQNEDRRLRAAILTALAALGRPEAFPQVVPFLDEPGDLGRRAMEAVASMGRPVLGKLRDRFPKAGDAGKRRILAIAARVRGTAGMDLILRALENGYAEQVLEAGRRLSEELGAATRRDLTALGTRLEKFLDSPAARKSAEAAAAGVDLLARISGAKVQSRLLEHAERHSPPLVRRRAIEALGRLAVKEKLEPAVLSRLLEFLQDSDFTNVVSPAMHALEQAPLSAEHLQPLLRCMESQDPALRRFAVAAFGQVDTHESARALLDVIAGDNPDLQKRAAVSLSKLRSCVPVVAGDLAKAPDAQTAWVLARILQPYAFRLEKDEVTLLAKTGAAWLEPGDPRAEAIVYVLRDRFSKELEDACLARVKRLKRDRKASEIANLLRTLVRDGSELDVQVRYELALAELVRGKKDVVREARLANPGLQALEPLGTDESFPLLTRLKREKSYLEPAEYYLIGSHFAERQFAERNLGGEILRWIVKTFPEDSFSQSAENKLLMEGFPPPPRPRPKIKPKARPKPKPKVQPKAEPKPKKAPAAKPKPAARKKTAPAKAAAKTAAKTAAKKAPKKVAKKSSPKNSPATAKKASSKGARKKRK